MSEPDPVQIPIDGVLDLHSFQPREIKDLIHDYLAACREKGIFQVRIIHGKGMGNLRRSVHAILAKHPHVTTYVLAQTALRRRGRDHGKPPAVKLVF